MRLYKTIDSHHLFNNQHCFTGFNKGVLVNFYKDGNNNFVRKFIYNKDITLKSIDTKELYNSYYL